MRFLMVCTFYPPYSFGGDAISIREWLSLIHISEPTRPY